MLFLALAVLTIIWPNIAQRLEKLLIINGSIMNLHNLPTGSRRYLDIARKLAEEIKMFFLLQQRLPPERELAQTLDVSRDSAEALLALEIMSL